MKSKHNAKCNKCEHKWAQIVINGDLRGIKCPQCKSSESMSLRTLDTKEEKEEFEKLFAKQEDKK